MPSRRVLVIGGGGRALALVAALARSKRVDAVLCAPGNAGTAQVAENISIPVDDHEALIALAKERAVDLTIVGPEDPLCAGIVDLFTGAGLRIFGPSSGAARIEGDKAYAQQFMKRAAIPTAEARILDHYDQARESVATPDWPLGGHASGVAEGVTSFS